MPPSPLTISLCPDRNDGTMFTSRVLQWPLARAYQIDLNGPDKGRGYGFTAVAGAVAPCRPV
jgi:hypothetical protein